MPAVPYKTPCQTFDNLKDLQKFSNAIWLLKNFFIPIFKSINDQINRGTFIEERGETRGPTSRSISKHAFLALSCLSE